jgi:tetratricopeptide (TPR) repeat protein
MMNDSERAALAEKLDADLEAFIESKVTDSSQKQKFNHSSAADMTVDELAAELKQHPAFMTEFDETQPMSPAMEALQVLKYQSESTDENAVSFKEDGNKNFERKKYRWAIENYTEGIKCKPVDRLLNAVLYTNRAAANFHIGNFRSSITDCILARKFKPDHLKAIVRGCQCCVELRKYADSVRWCDEGLAIAPTDEKLLSLRAKADKLLRQEERDRRKVSAKAKKDAAKDNELLDAIKSRGIKLEPSQAARTTDALTMSNLETQHPGAQRVSLDADGILHWPVMFVYPEFEELDSIAAFSEQSRFIDHVEEMFGEKADRPGWDQNKCYMPESIDMYFEDRSKERLHKVKQDSTLLETLKHSRYFVLAGTPSFILLNRHSPFTAQFLAKYK